VLVAQGGASGGYALYVKDHKLHYAYNYLGVQEFHVATTDALPRGRHELRFEFEPTGEPDVAHGRGTPGRAQLYVDGKLSGQIDLPVTIPLSIGITEGLTCGRDEGSTVTPDYEAPFAFTGTIEQIAVDVSGALIHDRDAEMRHIMAHQ
jgi:arylsulfatase